MIKPIYASAEHQTIIEGYIALCKDFVIEVIIEYHNNYGSGKRENNWYDWLMIIPINLSVATNGFFAGLETNKNRSVIRAYKVVLEKLVSEVADKIDNLEEPSE